MRRKYRLLQPLLRNNQFRSAFWKYFAGAASTALVAFAVYGAVSYSLYALSLRNVSTSFHEQNLYKTSEFVDYVFDGIGQSFYLLCNDENVLDLLKKSPEALADTKRSSVSRAIDAVFRETVLSPATESIYLFSEANRHFITWTDFRAEHDFDDASVLAPYRQGHLFSARAKRTGGDAPNVITIAREIVRDGEKLGVAFFNLKYDAFSSYVHLGFANTPETVVVADRTGYVFYATDSALVNTDLAAHPAYARLYDEAAQTGNSYMLDGDRVVSAVLSGGGSHAVISTMPDEQIVEFQRNFIEFAIVGSLLGLVIAFFIAFGISYQMYGNVIRMMSFLGAPQGGLDDGGAPQSDARREMNYITENMAGLVSRNNHIEHELAERLVELKKAQAIALQNQINPHFILNTLQMVNLDILSLTGGDTATTKVISLLSDILQSNLNTTDHIVPLSYEIRQAMKYIQIENLRNRGKFEVEWEIDEGLEAYQTVKFILQPVLENCLKHGLPRDNAPGIKIAITAQCEAKANSRAKALVLTIRDDGAGIAPDALADLRARLAQSHIQESRHIGLCNVDKRIKLVFGDAYGVRIDSAPGQGTTVCITQQLVGTDWS